MKKFLFIFFLCTSVYSFAQNRSVRFENLSLQQALDKAKSSSKLLFVDCYTSWCGPCKNLAANIFTNNDVADYFNQNFVSIKIDCEKGEGPAVAKRYGVSGFPTLLFLKADGSVHAKTVGGAMDPHQFIGRIKKELDPKTSLAGKEEKYAKGERDKAFMIDLIKSYQKIRNVGKIKSLSEELLSSLSEKELLTAEIWPVVSDYYVASYGRKWWNFMIAHSKDYEKSVGAEVFGRKVAGLIHPVIFCYSVAINKMKTQEEYKTFRSLVNDYQIDDKTKKTLNQSLDLAYSISFEDFDSYFKKLVGTIPEMDKNEHFRLLSNSMNFLLKNADQQQKGQLLDLIKGSMSLQNDFFKQHYQKLIERVEHSMQN